ncbi:MAG: hypothetical protein P4L45_15330 [Ignavibacteriaceae bacterium]|nr:hypothetical protein [Ignavibacteriaceae bacterium]
MTTLPPPGTNNFPDDSIEKQVYTIIDNLSSYLPIMNDRNRLGYALFKFMQGEGDSPFITLKNAKVKIEGIELEALAEKISVELGKIPKK